MYAIFAYIDPQNHPNVGIYGSPMGSLGYDLVMIQGNRGGRSKNTKHHFFPLDPG